ncbi:MAG: hypothetical protein IKE41_02410, partial [Clostridia bacterium]|nr:hypothetical protein [Clostridia bacterium]
MKKLWINKKRIGVLFALVLVVFGIFVARLADWQIINYNYYKIRANSSNIYFVMTDPVRGEILDRDGNGLVINDTGYKVVLDRLLIAKDEENGLILRLVKALEKFGNDWTDILPVKYESGEFIFFEGQDSEINTFKKVMKFPENYTADECIEKMTAKYKLEDFSPEDRRIICSVKYNM